MAEYIDREALIHDIDAAMENDGMGYVVGQTLKRYVKRVKAADVTPVWHGRWICINKSYGEYECSVCHGVDSNCSDYYGTHVVTEQDYCPNCGAVMEDANA